jgi:hypothetical protein
VSPYRDNEGLQEQLKLTNEINKSFEVMARLQEKIVDGFSKQSQALKDLTDVIDNLKNNGIEELQTDGLKKLVEDAAEAEESSTDLSDAMEEVADFAEKGFKSKILVGVGALTGLYQGFRNVVAVSKSVFNFLGSVAKGFTNVGLSILSIPFKMFDALVSNAASGGGSNELALALEELRDKMGDLKGPGASAVISATNSLQGFADTGLNAFRIFGTLAERLQAVTAVAVAMDASFGVLKQEFVDNGGALLAFQKGLGIADEEMKGIGNRAITVGKPFAKVMLDMTKQTIALGKAFDIDQKIIGKDMSKALQNVKHFGSLTVKEIATASVYARKLGVELDKITGTLDAFETFEGAAENVSKLSQTFGVQLDTFDLMNAQNPAEIVDQLRKSFRAAGVDSSNFTRAQQKMLAQTTGLDDATAKQVFSLENYGVSLDDVKKKSEGAEKKQKTQAEAMSDLSDSIKRMIKDGGQMENGFFKQFINGFKRGILASQEFIKMNQAIRKSLWETGRAGFDLGLAFIKGFDGLKDVTSGLTEFFSRIGSLATAISKLSKEFVKGEMSFESFMDRLRSLFEGFFDANSASFQKIAGGFKKVFVKLSKIAAEGIVWIAKRISEGMTSIAQLITDPSAFKKKAAAGAAGGLGFLAEILLPMAKALSNAAKIIWPSAKLLFVTVAKKVKAFLMSPEFYNFIKPAIIPLATMLFGPSLAQAALGALTSAIGNSIFSGAGLETLKKVFSTGLGKMFAGAGGIALAVGASISVGKAISEMRDEISSEFSHADRTIGAGVTGLLDALTLGLLPPGFKLTIATAVAELSTAFFDGVTNIFGSGFSDSFKQYLADQLDFIGKVGNAISALFSEDEDAFIDAAIELGKSLLKMTESSLKFLFLQIPVKLGEYAIRLIAMSFKILTKGVAKVFGGIGKFILEKIAPQWAEPFANMVSSVANKVTEFVDSITGGVKNASSIISSFISGTSQKVNVAAKKGAKRDFSGYAKLAVPEKQEEALTKDNKNASQVNIAIGEITSLEKTLQDKSLDLKKMTQGVRDKLKDVSFDLGLTDEKAAELSKASESAEKLSALFGSIDNAFSAMSSVPQNIAKTVTMIKAGALKPALDAVSKMVELANQMDAALGSGMKIETPIKLAAFASAVGLGAKANYTVTNKDVVINVHLKVDMNVDDVERVMIMRTKSIIRDQLNFAMNSPDKKPTGAPNIPEALDRSYSSNAKEGPT